MTTSVATHRFTVADYYRMAEAGILGEDDRVELIDGEIVDMAPIGSRHSACVARADALFAARLRDAAVVWVQNPIHLSEYYEPQPDVVLLRPRDDYYASGHPQPEDILLVVEVADSSLPYDRDVKALFYAQSGIPEYWLVDLDGQSVTRSREPGPDGYASTQTVRGDDRLSPLAFPDLVLTAAEILG